MSNGYSTPTAPTALHHHKSRRRHLPMTTSMSMFPPPFLPLLLLALALSILVPSVAAKPNCLRFADYNNINQAFTDGGPGTKVFLCPSKTYRLTGSIVFTAADQELATYGYPTGSERAHILVNGDFATLIQGDCRRCARVMVKSLVIDGNRPKLGRIVDAGLATGLIVLGGQEGQTISNCRIRDPRGFTAIHVREGDKLGCKGAVIEKNEIGPVGDEYDPRFDGPDPETSPLGRPLADGISIACRDSTVKDNNFYDNTDAAIVVYCSPGTLVHANTISTRKLSAMGGILMVDSTPFDGDYTGTVVKGNIIDAAARIIRVGIGLGAAVWSDDTETILKGGSVIANGLRGRYMGYGIAASGLKGWTVKDNWDESTHQGRRSARCFDDPVNPDPVAFLRNAELVTESEFQHGFMDQHFEYVVCIDGEEDPGNGFQDPPARPPPPQPAQPPQIPDEEDEGTVPPEELNQAPAKAPKAGAEPADPANPAPAGQAGQPQPPKAAPPPPPPAEVVPEPEGFSTGSEIMDDILEHSQQRMLESISVLAGRVDVLADAARISNGQDVLHKGEVIMSPQIAAALVDLQSRVATIESRQQTLIEMAKSMRAALQTWDSEMDQLQDWQYDVLLDVQHRLNLHMASPQQQQQQQIPPPAPAHTHTHTHPHPHVVEGIPLGGGQGQEGTTIEKLSNRARLLGRLGLHEESSWEPAMKFVFVQIVFLGLVWIARSWWSTRNHVKVL